MAPCIRNQDGFTMIELIIVIVLSGILSLAMIQFISVPVDAYVDQSRRARLVDIADNAINQITREVQQALPNSLRIGCAGGCVEFLRVATGGRYRAGPAGDPLSFVTSDADSSFDVLGPFSNFSLLTTSASPTACVEGSADCVAIYNTGQPDTDAWNTDHAAGSWKPDNLATLSAVSGSSVSFVNTNFSSGSAVFPAASPSQRFFVVDSPVSYLCDPVAGTMRRYEGYSMVHPHTAADEHAELTGLGNPAEHALVADQISACAFTYAAGTPSRNGLLSMRIRVSESGEHITLLAQVHVPNMP